MMNSRLFPLTIIVLLSRPAFGQARVVSAPVEPSLLNITRTWSRASALGDLRELRTRSDHLELRVWGGYGLAETQTVVLRRTDGHWSAFLGRVIRCEIQIPASVADTASQTTMHRYVAEARRKCGASVADVSAGARIITTDTLIVEQLEVQESEIEAGWNASVDAGLLQLPARVKRSSPVLGDFTYVIELRRGDEYRAAEIEQVDRPEAEADTQVKQIYAAVHRLLRAPHE
jgi:hypothetical protein